MTDKVKSAIDSKLADTLIKVAVPILIGVMSYGVTWMIEISNWRAAVEASRFTAKDGAEVEKRIAAHDTAIRLLEENQRRIMGIVERSAERELSTNQSIVEIKGVLNGLVKQLDSWEPAGH